jgi:1-acyl-sn-glycerol-3-phosphate acyltransferase
LEPGYRAVETVVVPLLAAWFRWNVEGGANIPRRGPAIVACNHISYLDPLVVAYVIRRAGRRPRFLAKSELFTGPLGWALRATGQIEVMRGTPQAPAALDRALAALESGEVVVIFPEGTVTTNPELEPMAPKSGAVRLALRARAPVIPCAVWGTAGAWPKGPYRKRWRPGQTILVRIGEPMTVEGSDQAPAEWRRAGERIMSEIALLVAGLRPALADTRRPRSPASAVGRLRRWVCSLRGPA